MREYADACDCARQNPHAHVSPYKLGHKPVKNDFEKNQNGLIIWRTAIP